MSEERELYEIRFQLECMIPSLLCIATALERMIPQGDERERVAFGLFVNSEKLLPARCYELADQWIAERDKQRAQAEANAQPPI